MMSSFGAVLQEYKIEDRVSTVIGDFFEVESIPKAGGIYILCRTLLNWSDKDATTIINNCAQAMKPNAKLLIIDFFIPEKTSPDYKRALESDAVLFVTFKSGNRTLPQ